VYAEIVDSESRCGGNNVQTIWEEFKTWIADLVKKMSKKSMGHTKVVVRNVEKDMRQINRCTDLDTDLAKQAQLSILDAKQTQLLEKLQRDRTSMAKVWYHDKAETPTAEWTKSNKERKPRDLLRRLRGLGPDSGTYSDSKNVTNVWHF
jgi:hypothetical protein